MKVFRHFAEKAHAVSSYWAFHIALLTIVVWALRDTSNSPTPGSFHQPEHDRHILDGILPH
jgi:hypothetical protein